ncbi:DNA primase [Lysobacter enzymogenes]|nr:DNA primase [Lysobacter enzymogenes]
MPITADQLAAAVGCTRALAATWAPYLAHAYRLADISTLARLAPFLAQTGHESAGFSTTTENLSYSAERIADLATKARPGTRWRSLGPRAAELARQPAKLANAAYGGRMGNRDEASGDGWRYRGRGLIQNTGRANYEAVRDGLRALGIADCPDFVALPDALSEPRWAALAAAMYWREHDLNALADAGDFDAITRRINGGAAGAADRRERYERAKKALRGVR